MKKTISILIAICMVATLFTAAFAAEFQPDHPITYNVSSKAGGNSDLIVRTACDIATNLNLVNGQTFVVVNNTDGSGNIIRITTHDTDDPDHTLLCMSAGDLSSMLTSDIGLKVEDFAPIAVLAADKQLMFGLAGSDLTTFEQMKAKIDAGELITVGGTKSRELTVYEMFIKEIGAEDSFDYIMYDSSAESITALMGGHIDFCMGSPAAAVAYVDSGDIVPVVAFSDERFEAPLEAAPTTLELGYNCVQSPMWRGVIAPGTMSEDAQLFWNDVFRQVTESEAWAEYLSAYKLSPYFNDLEASRTIFMDTQADILAEMAG